MRLRFTKVLFIFMLTALLSSCVTSKAGKEESVAEIKNHQEKSEGKISEEKIEKNLSYLHTEIAYPQFEGNDELNLYIKNSVQNYYSQFEKSAESDWIALTDASSDFPPFDYIVTYEAFSGKKYEGAVLFTYIFNGGAHGSTFITSFNYDKNEAMMVQKLSDALSLSYEQISDSSRKELLAAAQKSASEASEAQKELWIEERKEWIFRGTEATPGNFEHFLLKDKSCTLYFEEYAVAPYSEGIQKVTLLYGR